MEDQAPARDIERDGFVKMTLVALTANMAAANIHSGRRLDWTQIVPNAMEGVKECWNAIVEERDADKGSD